MVVVLKNSKLKKSKLAKKSVGISQSVTLKHSIASLITIKTVMKREDRIGPMANMDLSETRVSTRLHLKQASRIS